MDEYTDKEYLLPKTEECQLTQSYDELIRRFRYWKRLFYTACFAFLLSAFVNLHKTGQLRDAEARTLNISRTQYAQLEFNHNTFYDREKEPDVYTDMNWEYIYPDLGVIAINDDEAVSLGLPLAQRFPWDDSKGVYFLGAYHSLHCLQNLATTIFELRDGKPLSMGMAHTMHCLHSIRSDIECFADDTPRYTSVKYPGLSGTEQRRVCRDFSKLKAWATDRWACWRYLDPGKDIDILLRYRYCPPGSPYYEKIKQVFPEEFAMELNASTMV